MQQHLKQQQQPAAAANPAALHLQALPGAVQQQQHQELDMHHLNAPSDVRKLLTASAAGSIISTGSSSNGGSSSSRSRSRRSLQDNAAGVTLPRINVLGSGRLSGLGVPQELRAQVFVYKDLGYTDYYDTVCR